MDNYDIVIVDCPPNLSTYGIPQILERVHQFSEEIAEEIKPLGIIIAKCQRNSTVHNNTIRQLRQDPQNPRVFGSIIAQANQFAGAAEYSGQPTS